MYVCMYIYIYIEASYFNQLGDRLSGPRCCGPQPPAQAGHALVISRKPEPMICMASIPNSTMICMKKYHHIELYHHNS